jgi:hypothetical protein
MSSSEKINQLKNCDADPLRNLSVIVPLAAGERLWRDLLLDLVNLPEGSEVILVGAETIDQSELDLYAARGVFKIRYVPGVVGRALQMNKAAYASDKKYLWFLHADSKIPKPTLHALRSALAEAPEALHFFELRFLDDGPRLVGLNKAGANLRSRFLNLPFGHQGFAISRAQFLRIGSFSEDLPEGEDQAFVWEAHRKRIPVRAIRAPIFTSARRYESEGWTKTTSSRLWGSTKQAMGEYFKLLRGRLIS